jgi:hypothetical protein
MWRWVFTVGAFGAFAAATVYAQNAVKPLTALDYAEIQQLYARYAWSIDTHADNGMVYAGLFTLDGEFHSGQMRVAGRDQLAAFNRSMGVPNRAPTHFNANLVIDPSPEGAHGSVYLIVTGGEKPAIGMVGSYQDILVRTSEGWRFKRRTLYSNGMPPPAP